jgi:hypothetical protein
MPQQHDRALVSLRTVLIKLSVLLVLLTCSVQVFASCQSLEAGGWEVFSICGANFDSQGNYVDSTCRLGDPPEPGQTSFNACLGAPAVGGCSGTACAWDPFAN